MTGGRVQSPRGLDVGNDAKRNNKGEEEQQKKQMINKRRGRTGKEKKTNKNTKEKRWKTMEEQYQGREEEEGQNKEIINNDETPLPPYKQTPIPYKVAEKSRQDADEKTTRRRTRRGQEDMEDSTLIRRKQWL